MSKRSYPINPQQWINHLGELRGENNIALVQTAMRFYNDKLTSLLEKGIGIADILLALGLDNETLAAALLYPALQANEIHLDFITEALGESSSKLLYDVLQMQSLGKLRYLEQRSSHQIENIRKMLLAMVKDIRSVLVILAERLLQLRLAKQLSKTEQEKLAAETLSVYAPLANRLGVWQLKWEIEDLCLRYLHSDIYTQIAKGIASRRDDRESYIKSFITLLTQILEQAGIKQFQVSGRVKHIYSIYHKMQRKGSVLEKIYDMSALRVLVQSVEDCYGVLGVLQSHWQQVPEEFDDYINHPKPNGYRSIHTVVIGPQNHFVEIQIRTHQMHQESELGVAAHWRYKEGVLQAANYEEKIALLRQIMAWQKEVVNTDEIKSEQPKQDLFADRIYVFTPTDDIIDLPKGATPLDFAYHIHSEVGHRCRGAKVNGHIVPLTHPLPMGARVEILTTKQANPSRDWLNPHYGYLITPRARATVQHWFRVKDSIQLEEESRETAAPRETQPTAPQAPVIEQHKKAVSAPDIHILGINNLLTHIAGCCKPLPGDDIVGYVTRNRGVSIHRRDCANALHIISNEKNRLIEVNWGEKHAGTYPTDLLIRVYDQPGMLKDIASLLVSEKINVRGINTQKVSDSSSEVDIYITIDIENKQQLKSALDHLKNIPNVIDVRRR